MTRPFIISIPLLVVAEDAWPEVSRVLSGEARRKFSGAKSASGVRIRALHEFSARDIVAAVAAGARVEHGDALIGEAPEAASGWDCVYESIAFRLRRR